MHSLLLAWQIAVLCVDAIDKLQHCLVPHYLLSSVNTQEVALFQRDEV